MKTSVKKLFKKALRSLIIGLILVAVSFYSFSQRSLVKMCNLNITELNTKFKTLSGDSGFKILLGELKEKGWSKINVEGASYGFTGIASDSLTRATSSVEFYAYDFYNKTTKQMGSVIWRNDGKSVYKAYLTFPAGEKDFDKALEGSVEMYVEAGKIQTASSWGKCFKKCVKNKCAGFCIVSVTGCLAATIVIDLATGGAAAGLSIAFWIGCSGILCGHCFLTCALDCR
jgi:hypothetical protein